MPTFNGTLNTNEIFSAIYNMIIGQRVFADNIADGYTSLVDRARVDGSMYGDQYLYYSTDALNTIPYMPDTNGQLNVLKTFRNKNIEVLSIEMTEARQIPVTIDNYFSKRAFSTDSVFADFNGVMLKWLSDTKKVYDQTIYNTYVGTTTSTIGKQNIQITLPERDPTADDPTDVEACNRIQAQTVAELVANTLVELRDVSRDYNDYGYLRSYDTDDLIVIWNSEWVNKISKLDLPTIFHKDGLMDKFDESNVIPARYFGVVNAGTTAGNGTTIRATQELYFNGGGQEIDFDTVGDPDNALNEWGGDQSKHVFAGDLIPVGCTAAAGHSYRQEDDIICKIIAKDSVPYMSAFSVNTEFINARNLSENHYLTFAHNNLEYLKEKPFITIANQ